MFDIGWTEIIVILVVGSLVLEAKDLPKIVKWIRGAIKYANGLIAEFKQIFHDLEHETKKITDSKGQEHIAYDLDDITPDLKKEDNDTRSKN